MEYVGVACQLRWQGEFDKEHILEASFYAVLAVDAAVGRTSKMTATRQSSALPYVAG